MIIYIWIYIYIYIILINIEIDRYTYIQYIYIYYTYIYIYIHIIYIYIYTYNFNVGFTQSHVNIPWPGFFPAFFVDRIRSTTRWVWVEDIACEACEAWKRGKHGFNGPAISPFFIVFLDGFHISWFCLAWKTILLVVQDFATIHRSNGITYGENVSQNIIKYIFFWKEISQWSMVNTYQISDT